MPLTNVVFQPGPDGLLNSSIEVRRVVLQQRCLLKTLGAWVMDVIVLAYVEYV